jgi:hypothetical protein
LNNLVELMGTGVLEVAAGGAHGAANRQCEFGRIVILLVTGETALEAMSEPVALFGVHKNIAAAAGTALEFPVCHISPHH